MSASLKHAYLQSFTKVLDSPCHRFWGRSFQIISSLVRCSSIVDGLLSSSFCLRNCEIVMLTTYVTNLILKLVVVVDELLGVPVHPPVTKLHWYFQLVRSLISISIESIFIWIELTKTNILIPNLKGLAPKQQHTERFTIPYPKI